MNYEGQKADTERPTLPKGSRLPHRRQNRQAQPSHRRNLLLNGLCFSPDYKKPHAADTGASHYKEAKKQIKALDVADEKTLKTDEPSPPWNWKSPADLRRMADGIRCDADGNACPPPDGSAGL